MREAVSSDWEILWFPLQPRKHRNFIFQYSDFAVAVRKPAIENIWRYSHMLMKFMVRIFMWFSLSRSFFFLQSIRWLLLAVAMKPPLDGASFASLYEACWGFDLNFFFKFIIELKFSWRKRKRNQKSLHLEVVVECSQSVDWVQLWVPIEPLATDIRTIWTSWIWHGKSFDLDSFQIWGNSLTFCNFSFFPLSLSAESNLQSFQFFFCSQNLNLIRARCFQFSGPYENRCCVEHFHFWNVLKLKNFCTFLLLVSFLILSRFPQWTLLSSVLGRLFSFFLFGLKLAQFFLQFVPLFSNIFPPCEIQFRSFLLFRWWKIWAGSWKRREKDWGGRGGRGDSSQLICYKKSRVEAMYFFLLVLLNYEVGLVGIGQPHPHLTAEKKKSEWGRETSSCFSFFDRFFLMFKFFSYHENYFHLSRPHTQKKTGKGEFKPTKDDVDDAIGIS